MINCGPVPQICHCVVHTYVGTKVYHAHLKVLLQAYLLDTSYDDIGECTSISSSTYLGM